MTTRYALLLLASLTAAACNKKPAEPAAAAEASGAPAAPAAIAGSGEGSAAASAFAPPSARQTELQTLASQALQSGNKEAALAAFMGLRDSEPMSEIKAMGTLMLAQMYQADNDSKRTLEVLVDLQKKAPPFAQLEYVLGSVLAEQKNNTEAEAALRRSIRIEPAFLPAYVSLIKLFKDAGRAEQVSEISLQFERQTKAVGEKLNSQIPDEEKIRVVQELSFTGEDPLVTRAIMEALDDKSLDVRGNAAVALAQVGTVDAIPALTAMGNMAEMEQLKQVASMAIEAIKTRATAPQANGSGAEGSGAPRP